eukprot:CAMPEP_0115383472 /NCGR_PEP_ID=MMETSP0271-20121206/6613_1 /TAXON_ID=71861 /ORGANISM="Scrippsiella trochoidea, Strain CCMP3099" /LENGTH=211 /DNA_ID=CAMNT_0002806803 /DNA_START=3 /DNA_END=638 /DNA_ORIENTATION=+
MVKEGVDLLSGRKFPAATVWFEDYIYLKAFEEAYANEQDFDTLRAKWNNIKLESAQVAIRYCNIHKELFGDVRPFPTEPSEKLRAMLLREPRTIIQFLRQHKLHHLIGALQYAYSVQGYGSLEAMPALYLFIWITPAVLFPYGLPKKLGANEVLGPYLWCVCHEYSKVKNNLPVTAWSQGWGSIWKQLKEDFEQDDQVRIKYEVRVTDVRL